MGISDKKGFDAKKDEVKRQLKNLGRDFSRPQKQDIKAGSSDNIATGNADNSELPMTHTL